MARVDRVHASDLTAAAFVEKYVKHRLPVVIEGTPMPTQHQWGLGRIAARCGNRTFQLASHAQRAFILNLPESLMDSMIDALKAITGEDVIAFFDRTLFDEVTITSFLESFTAEAATFTTEAALAAQIRAATGGDEFLSAVLGVILRPRYLNDRPLDTWCPAMLEDLILSKYARGVRCAVCGGCVLVQLVVCVCVVCYLPVLARVVCVVCWTVLCGCNDVRRVMVCMGKGGGYLPVLGQWRRVGVSLCRVCG
jgi:hypothetical protein